MCLELVVVAVQLLFMTRFAAVQGRLVVASERGSCGRMGAQLRAVAAKQFHMQKRQKSTNCIQV